MVTHYRNAISLFSNILTVVIILSIAGRLYYLAQPVSKLFAKTYEHELFEKAYLSSQYIQEVNPGVIPDETLYSYAAGNYLYGGNPILVNPETPPLGKYFISLSIVLFTNTLMAVYFFFCLMLLSVFMLAKLVIHNVLFASSIILLLLVEPLIISQLEYAPLLDIFQLPFIIFSLYFFIKWISCNERKDYLLYLFGLAMCIGIVVSVKFFITGLVLCITCFVYLTLQRKFKNLIVFSVAAGIGTYAVLTISYLRTLINNPDPLSVLKIQKWILWYNSSKLTTFFTIWPLIYLNQWHTWWGTNAIIRDDMWWIGWPTVFTGSFISTLFTFIKDQKDSVKLLVLWFLLYAVLLSISQASSRYILSILPVAYILTGYTVVTTFSRINFSGK